MYPAEFLIVLLYSIAVTLISAPVCFFMEPDLKAWSIRTDMMLLALLYAVRALMIYVNPKRETELELGYLANNVLVFDFGRISLSNSCFILLFRE